MARDGERSGISRRTLLVGGGAGIGLALAWAVWPRGYQPNLPAGPGETIFNAFLKIGRDGRVIVAVPQAEVGQGVTTSLPQILADELGADWRTIAIEPAPINPLYANTRLAEEAVAASGFPATFGVDRWTARQYAIRNALMATGGSTSVRMFEAPLRAAGAAARALLCMAAARRWGEDWRALDAHDGFVWRGRERIAFAELAEAAAGENVPDDPPMRGGVDNRLAGRSLPRLDVPSKIDGTAMFAGDVRLPGMVYAAVRMAPRGGRVIGLDRDAGRAVFGVLELFENPGWVGVAAVNSWAAGKAIDAMNPRFEAPADAPSSADIAGMLDHALDTGSASHVFRQGSIDEHQAGSSPISQSYRIAPMPSAAVEPLTATARLTGDRLEIWAPVMAPELARAAAAQAAGIGEGQVTLYPSLVGGGHGRKLETAAVEQVAIMAMRLARPVQLSWPRISEIQRDTFGPPAAALMTAFMVQGRIAGWRARIAMPDAGAQTATRLGTSATFFSPGGAPAAGAVPPYGIANIEVDHVPLDVGLDLGVQRGGTQFHGCYFTECFVDELARAAGAEPFSFRMQMLGDHPRLARVLSTATAIGGWDGGAAGGGMGIACHAAYGSYVATLVEIELTREQRIRMLRAVCAVDCGRVVNPEIVRQQIEGGLIHGIACATGRPLGFARGVPAIRTIGDYGLPILADSPEVSVELIESDDDPGGVTELAVPTAAPAIANACYALNGRRPRSLPIDTGAQS
jgi:isoquinoline 1-oxidoreductase beta subunit